MWPLVPLAITGSSRVNTLQLENMTEDLGNTGTEKIWEETWVSSTVSADLVPHTMAIERTGVNRPVSEIFLIAMRN